MIVSLLYRLTRRLLSVPTVWLRRDTAKDAELLVLRHKNAVLRRQITGQIRYEPADRLWFAALSSLLPQHRWHAIFPVQPATILAWRLPKTSSPLVRCCSRGRQRHPLTANDPTAR
jgi:putative transposase